MPYSTVRLTPGVNVEMTPTANQAGISTSNLIRFRDGIPEKIGGWAQWNGVNVGSAPRALWAWEDLNANTYLAVGAVNSLTYTEISNGVPTTVDITPQYIVSSGPPSFSTVSGSNVVTIRDVGSNVTLADVVVVQIPVSVGGLIVFGSYQVYQSQGPDQYQILATQNATATVSNAGTLPSYSTLSGSNAVTVTLPTHGYSVGATYAAISPTAVGGLTVSGLYTVTAVTDANTFVINANTLATNSATATVNGGNVMLRYWVTPISQTIGAGYGIGGYGKGGYGVGVKGPPHFGTKLVATDYSLDNWGQDLVAIPDGGGVFIWTPNSAYIGSQLLANAPSSCTGGFVAMPEQQIVVYGASVEGIPDPMLVAFSDIGNFNVWTAAVTNSAGTYRIPRGSKIIGGMQGPSQGLLWTDLALWLMVFEGGEGVFGFDEIASGCGLLAKKAAAILSTSVYWMSQKSFFTFANGTVSPLPCSVWDAIFQNLNLPFASNIRAAANSQFGEVTWYYPSLASVSGENDSYVKFNTVSGVWDYGLLQRTAWINQSVLGSPIGSDSAGEIYQHEISPDANGSAISASFSTGYFQINEGEDFVFVDKIVPDFKWGNFGGSNPSANVQITLSAYAEPDTTPVTRGPYTVTSTTPFVSTRIRGRYFTMSIASNDLGSFWRLGAVKFRFSPDGRR